MPITEAESDIIPPTESVCMTATEMESDMSSVERVLTSAIVI